MKRLIKKAEFHNGYMKEDKMIEIYKNPTNKEISDCKKENPYNAVRGVIYPNGTEYCWSGHVLHDIIDKSMGVDVDSSNHFRFAFEESNGWILDSHQKYTMKELVTALIKYKDKLSKYGDLDLIIETFNSSGDEYDMAFENFGEVESYLDDEYDEYDDDWD